LLVRMMRQRVTHFAEQVAFAHLLAPYAVNPLLVAGF
jgi:hypothetical protein